MNKIVPAVILFILTLVLYSGNTNYPMVFDDTPTMTHAVTGDWSQLAPRPVCNWTFQYQFDNHTWRDFHIMNNIIHAATVVLLFLTLLEFSGIGTAFVLAFLFAVHPINIQAVTYITQRYASLVTFFGLLSFYALLRWDKNKLIGFPWFVLMLSSYILAFYTKQNAYILPFVFIFYYILKIDKLNKWHIIGMVVLGLTIVYVSTFHVNYHKIFLCRGREFSTYERILTEPRVVMRYLHQLFYPVPAQFNISHYIDLSRNWTDSRTILCIFGHLLIVCYAFSTWKTNKIITLGIISFYIMMIPESTFANLELIFEHRMYFPLCFLLIALSQIKPKYISLIALLAIICIPCNIERQKAWKDNATLWEDAARKSPLCARTQYNYACGLVNRGELERAISVLKLVPRLPAWRANEPHKLAKALLDDSGYDDCKDKSMYVALRTKKIRYIPLQLHDLQAKKFKPETLTTFNPDTMVTISTSK